MDYPYKYPKLYGELAMQGKEKKALAAALGITTAGLAYKQKYGDFAKEEMCKAASFLQKPMAELFDLKDI